MTNTISDHGLPGTSIDKQSTNHQPMKNTLTTIALSVALMANAQTEVLQSSFSFSDGDHPTVVVSFENSDADAVENWYKNQLKDVSKDVTSKKELRAQGARVPEVAQDTLTVLCKAEQGKKNTRVMLHLAFKYHGNWLSKDGDEKALKGAERYAYMLAVRYKKQVLEAVLGNEQKSLGKMESDLAGLEKEKARAESGIEKNKSKGQEATGEKAKAEKDLKDNETSVASKHAAMGTNPTEEEAKQFQELVKEGTKLKEKIAKETKNITDAEAKVKELEDEVKKLSSDIEVKRRGAEEQKKKVEDAQKAAGAVN